MNNIIIFATYWNEKEWIEASLAQIDKINPLEVVICDGCFDPKYPLHSTDGTREILEKYASKRQNCKLISPLRMSYLQHYFYWFSMLPHEQRSYIYAKLKKAIYFHKLHLYRLNQAATFNYMIKISKNFSPGLWFMTYDCDQFYGDEVIESFKLCNDLNLPYDTLTATEYTFFGDFFHYTEEYETRDYNNMPHRIYESTRFLPTRDPVRIVNGKYRLYSEVSYKKFIGRIFHYKIRSKDRSELTYLVGDRKPPEPQRCITQLYTGKHPTIVEQFFRKIIEEQGQNLYAKNKCCNSNLQ
ncbi:MAG: hypothetical protein N2643_04420 [Endomicrobia bacterium]|nr:hypothetical protein [Endomicrobiia bacterium]